MSSCRFVTGGEGAIREHVTVAHTCTSHLIWPLSSTLTLKPWPMGARLCGQVWRGCSKGTEIDPLGHCPVPNSVMTLVTPPGGSFHHQTRVVESRRGLYSNPTQTPAGSQENSAVSVSGKLVAYYPPVYTPHTQQRSARRRPIAQGHRVAPLATPYRSSPVPILALALAAS